MSSILESLPIGMSINRSLTPNATFLLMMDASIIGLGSMPIGLSALMTTTMREMDHVIQLAGSTGQGELHFIVGGAVLTEEYARKIGASYAKDAMASVRLAKKIAEKE